MSEVAARKGAFEVEEKAKPVRDRRSLAWAELEEKDKDDPELAKQMDAAKHVIEPKNSSCLTKERRFQDVFGVDEG